MKCAVADTADIVMKPCDPGYKRRLRMFKLLFCKHHLDTANPIKSGCPYRVRIVDSVNELVECPHQPGWHCSNKHNPGYLDLADLVLEAL